MSPRTKLSTVVLVLAACVATSISVSAEDTPARVRGTLQKMDGNTLTIATKSGKETMDRTLITDRGAARSGTVTIGYPLASCELGGGRYPVPSPG
jgi:hypothetical protein